MELGLGYGCASEHLNEELRKRLVWFKPKETFVQKMTKDTKTQIHE